MSDDWSLQLTTSIPARLRSAANLGIIVRIHHRRKRPRATSAADGTTDSSQPPQSLEEEKATTPHSLDDSVATLVASQLGHPEANTASRVYLELRHLSMSRESLERVVLSAPWGGGGRQWLVALDLEGNQLRDEGFQRLVQAMEAEDGVLRHVLHLYVASNQLTGESMRRLAESAATAQLRTLGLTNNPFGPNCAKDLAVVIRKAAQLERLHLNHCGIGREGWVDEVCGALRECLHRTPDTFERCWAGQNEMKSDDPLVFPTTDEKLKARFLF